MSEKKLRRVTLEYQDGSSQFLEGADAERWGIACSAEDRIAYVHGYRFPGLNWTQVAAQDGFTPRRIDRMNPQEGDAP